MTDSIVTLIYETFIYNICGDLKVLALLIGLRQNTQNVPAFKWFGQQRLQNSFHKEDIPTRKSHTWWKNVRYVCPFTWIMIKKIMKEMERFFAFEGNVSHN